MIRQICFNADRLMRGNYRYRSQSYVGWTFSIIAFFLKWSEYNFNWFFDVADVNGRFADVDVFMFLEKKSHPSANLFSGSDAVAQGQVAVRLPPAVGLLRRPVPRERSESDGAGHHDLAQVLAEGPLAQGGHVPQRAGGNLGRHRARRVPEGQLQRI